MSKPKHDVANALPEVELDSAGFAHGLHLLLLAIARTNPSVGALLDEFTSMHAEYLAELQGVAREQEDYLPVMREAVAEGKARAHELAMFEDRVAVNHGRPQIYGSQVDADGLLAGDS